jgi:hypothetical protein
MCVEYDGNPADERQPEAEALVPSGGRTVRLREVDKDGGVRLRVQGDAGIPYLQPDPPVLRRRSRDQGDHCARWGVFQRVVQEFVHRPREPLRVDQDRSQVARDASAQIPGPDR